MSKFNLGVVIPVGPGREENIDLTLMYLGRCPLVQAVMLVLDGSDVRTPHPPPMNALVYVTQSPRHQPGREQPRNFGVRQLVGLHPNLTHVWFLDSDILVRPDAAVHFGDVALDQPDSILIGPYEWLPWGVREPVEDLFNDGRWAMFHDRNHQRSIADLGVALGNFSGNLVWPIGRFIEIGGFHPQLHHGRCEDGELGLRAASAEVPMTLVAEARGWHLEHERNQALTMQRNARDVPLLNSWHPWVQEQGLVVTERDGARFEFQCQCGTLVNTGEMWAHLASHRAVPPAKRLNPPEQTEYRN